MARISRSLNNSNGGGAGGADAFPDRLPIFLRGYAAIAPRPESENPRLRPGEWTLVLDTETTTDAVQRLRIGAYQLLEAGTVQKCGLFFDPNAVTEEEVELLRAEKVRLRIDELRARDEFIEEIVFEAIFGDGGTIVGLNLPFDLSRLALDWTALAAHAISSATSTSFGKVASRSHYHVC